MVQGYYTLDEAARILGLPTEELSQMAQRHEVRGFTDRGTWRFRTQDIEELARRRGLGSNPDLPLGESSKPKPHDSPAPKSAAASDSGAFHFDLGEDSDQVEIGQEMIAESPSGRKTGSKPSRPAGAKTPSPRASDSDVRLVSDGSDVGLVSDSKTRPDEATARPSSKRRPGPNQDSGVRLVMDQGPDSDVQIVPDSDKDIQILGTAPKTKSDSDIRLEPGSSVRRAGAAKGADDSFLTEEIDLDAELRKADEAARPKKSHPRAKTPPPKVKTPLPRSSPFELSDADVNVAPQEQKAEAPQTPQEDSSDFDLSIAPEDLSPLEVSSGEMAPLKESSEEVSLGDMPAKATGTSSDSGINLQEPADSGISLEQAGDSSSDVEFELSLDAESTPKPAKAEPNVDSSSEFELTLEDSARLAPLEEEAAVKGSKEEKDIFETDFDVPALEEESGSQVAALQDSDTELESSDFDLALGEEDVAAEEESGSQVVALEDEEEVDEGAATVARPRPEGVAEEEPGEILTEQELEAEEEAAPRPAVVAAAAPADWGIFTPVVLAVSTVILFFVGVMSYELVHGMWSYHQPGSQASSVVVRGFAKLVGYSDKDLP